MKTKISTWTCALTVLLAAGAAAELPRSEDYARFGGDSFSRAGLSAGGLPAFHPTHPLQPAFIIRNIYMGKVQGLTVGPSPRQHLPLSGKPSTAEFKLSQLLNRHWRSAQTIDLPKAKTRLVLGGTLSREKEPYLFLTAIDLSGAQTNQPRFIYDLIDIAPGEGAPGKLTVGGTVLTRQTYSVYVKLNGMNINSITLNVDNLANTGYQDEKHSVPMLQALLSGIQELPKVNLSGRSYYIAYSDEVEKQPQGAVIDSSRKTVMLAPTDLKLNDVVMIKAEQLTADIAVFPLVGGANVGLSLSGDRNTGTLKIYDNPK